jgi:hypothetical protein
MPAVGVAYKKELGAGYLGYLFKNEGGAGGTYI